MKNNFILYSSYYDLLYLDKNYASESGYVINLIRSLSNNSKTILEYGCGTGNHAKYFCDEGFTVIGLEKSEEMVDIAKRKCIPNFHPQIGDITSFEIDKKVDVVTALFHVISYLTSNEDLLNCFRITNRHLNEGGYLIFDVWYGPAVYTQQPTTRIKRLENDEIEFVRLAEPVWQYNRNVVDVNYEIIATNKKDKITERFSETHPMRYFTIPELELLAKQTGFEIVKVEEFLTGKAPDTSTWGVCFILNKIENV